MIAGTSLSLTACGGRDDGAKAANTAAGTAVSAASSPTPSSDPLFTEGKVSKSDLSDALATGMKTMTTYRTEGSLSVIESGKKDTIKLSSDSDARDQAKPKVLSHVSTPDGKIKEDVVFVGKDIYKKSGSKWVKGTDDAFATAMFRLMTDPHEGLSASRQAIGSASYVGKESRGHRFDAVLDAAKLPYGKDIKASHESLKATYWLDDSKRVLGMKIEVTEPKTQIITDQSMSKFGEPVKIPQVH
ncbi:hypothetical protein [Cutibacterium porci]|uniref:hypothetical protein n=1 Tax=Cutibacterium porci TaxID=2605781 RepID=UPI001E323E73|nr:hypothetical protein [Cutibacterium porci]